MRQSLRKNGFALIKFLIPVSAIALLTFSMMGCQDTRISVREFIAMQRRLDAERAQMTSTSPRCTQANRVHGNARPQPIRSVQPVPRRTTSNAMMTAPLTSMAPAAPLPPVPQSPRSPAPMIDLNDGTTGDDASAVRETRMMQVNYNPQRDGAKGKPNWFFDRKRGEWVQVKLLNRPRVRRASMRPRQYPAEAYASLAPMTPIDPPRAVARSNDSFAYLGNDANATPRRRTVEALAPANDFTARPIDPRMQLINRPYLLGPEDMLSITLTGLTGIETIAEPATVYARVTHDGTINLPLVGALRVGGVEIIEAEQRIHAAYVPKFVPTLAVGVRVDAYKTTDVVVVGAAEFPGLVQLRRNQRTALHAVAAAGGMTQHASGEVIIQRIRDPQSKISVFLRNSADLQAVLAMDPLESGDVIQVVAAQPNTIFVGGLVNMPGPREFPAGTEVSALQALAAAGGVVEAVFPSDATLIRRMPNGEDVHVRIDLDKTRSGEDPNIMLAAGDIFWVPETWATRTMAFINQSFFIRAGATVSYNVTGVEFLNRPRQQVGNVGSNNVRNSVDPLGFLVP